MKSILFCLVLIGLLSLLSPPAALGRASQAGSKAASPPDPAQTGPNLTLQVEPYFHGQFKYGEWLPLRVTLANDGAPFVGQVRVETQALTSNAWVTPVELPTGARKQLTVYTLPPSFVQTLRVRVMSGNQEVARQNATVRVQPNSTYLVGVLASPAETFNALNGIMLKTETARPVHPLTLTLADLPDRPEGLRVLDALIISNVDTSALPPEAARALQSWVAEGGRLILGGGASASRTLAGLPDALVGNLRPLARTIELADLEGLSRFAGQEVRVPGLFVVTPAASGRPLIEQDGLALLVEQRVGQGFVTYSALDLASSPFDAWAGAPRFWETILWPGSEYPPNAPPDVSPRLIRRRFVAQTLYNLPVLALPSLNVLAVLLSAYIILVGPINYLVLRRVHKLDWGWLSIPGLTLLFAAGAFGVSHQLRGSDIIINQLSILNLYANGTAAPLETLIGVFSPVRESFTLELDARGLVNPILNPGDPFGRDDTLNSSIEIVAGDPTQVRGVQINQGALQTLAVESLAPENWRVEAILTEQGGRVRGTIINRLHETLQDAILVNDDRYIHVGDLPPNRMHNLDNFWQMYGGPVSVLVSGASESQARRHILDNYFGLLNGPPQPPRRPLLLGWLASSPLAVRIRGTNAARQEMTLVLVFIDLREM